jgi:hypothetical protein
MNDATGFLFVYAFHVDKLPIILGVFFLPFLYARNLSLLHRNRGEPEPVAVREKGCRFGARRSERTLCRGLCIAMPVR